MSGSISLKTPFAAELDAIETAAAKPSQRVGFLHNPSELFIARNHGNVNDQKYEERISETSIPPAPSARLTSPYARPYFMPATSNGQDLAESAYPAREIRSVYYNSNHNFASLPPSPERLDEVQQERERVRREEVFPLEQRLKKMELSLAQLEQVLRNPTTTILPNAQVEDSNLVPSTRNHISGSTRGLGQRETDKIIRGDGNTS